MGKQIELQDCICASKPILREYFIKGVANHKNYFVKCEKCRIRTRSRKTPWKAIEEWNEFKGDLFFKERGM